MAGLIIKRSILKRKLHRVTATHSDVNSEGSCSIDEDLLDATNALENQRGYIWNVDNGKRFFTYTIKGERGSGVIALNGSTAGPVTPGRQTDYRYLRPSATRLLQEMPSCPRR